MSLAGKVAYNTAIHTSAKLVSTIIGLLSVAIMGRYLGQAGFGQYTTIMTYLSFFGVIADFGLTLVTSKMLSEPGTDESRLMGNLFGLRLVLAAVFLGAAPLAVIWLPYARIVKVGIAITTLTFFFTALNQIMIGFFQKKLRMERAAIAEAAPKIFLIAAIAAAAYFDWGLLGIMLATVISSLIGFGLHWIFAGQICPIRPRFERAEWERILKNSWPIAVTIAFNLIYLKADTLILSLIKSETAVGIYGAAYKVIDVLTMFPYLFAGITLPIMTQAWLNHDRTDLNKLIQRSFDLLIITALPFAVGAQLVASPLMALAAGADFAVSGPALRWLALALLAIYPGCLFSHVIIAVDCQKKIIPYYVLISLTALAGYIWLIPKYSYFGAAGVTIYSEAAIALAAYLLAKRQTGLKLGLKVSFKAVLASLAMAAGIIGLERFGQFGNVIGLIVFGAAIYGVVLYLAKGITKQDIREILRKEA